MRACQLFALAAATVGALGSAALAQQTFSNTTAITVPVNGVANLYPSTINVAGGPATCGRVTVRLIGVTHTNLDDLDVLLVAPSGDKIMLMSDAGGSLNWTGATVQIETGAPPFPDSGTDLFGLGSLSTAIPYSPTNYQGDAAFPAPAPAAPYGTDLGVLSTDSPNGVWSLYIVDDLAPNSGGFSGGWSITFNSLAPTSTGTAFTYQGRLDNGASPASPNADFQFSLWESASSTSPTEKIGATLSRNGIPLDNGQFTVSLDYGNVYAAGRWLEIAVRSPAGAGAFTTLTPRQRLTPTPLASGALSLVDSSGAFLPAARSDSSANLEVLQNLEVFANAQVTGTFAIGDVAPTVSTEASLADGTGRLQIGDDQGSNLVLDTNEIQARLDGAATDLLLNPSGGNVYIPSGSRLGVGTTAPTVPLQSATGVDVSLADGTGYAMIGTEAGLNLVMDSNEFQARSNGVAATLFLNSNGGAVNCNTTTTTGTGLNVGGTAAKTGGGAWLVLSDQRLKHDIKPLSGTLDKLLNIHGVSYEYNDPKAINEKEGTRIGMVAQEVEKFFPDWVVETPSGYKAIGFTGFEAVTVEALRDLRSEKDAQIKSLKDENDALKARLERIEKLLSEKK